MVLLHPLPAFTKLKGTLSVRKLKLRSIVLQSTVGYHLIMEEIVARVFGFEKYNRVSEEGLFLKLSGKGSDFGQEFSFHRVE